MFRYHMPQYSMDHHHPGLIPDRGRFLGNQFFREAVFEFF